MAKLAFATSFPADPAAPHGGVEAVSVNLVGALAQFDDLDIEVVTVDDTITANVEIEWNGVRIHRLAVPKSSELLRATRSGRAVVADFIRQMAPDIIHAHDTYGIMVRGLPIPRVFTVHGFIYGDTLISRKKVAWLRSQIWKRVETGAWADQPHIISISPYVRERVSRFSRANIHDIDNPLSASFFEPVQRKHEKVVFSAATINARKNPLMLIQAVKKMLDEGVEVTLRLAGKVMDEQYGAEVNDYIAQHNLKDNVHLLGSISSQQVKAELCAASIFALVSLEENSPMGIEEAMAIGLPVVSSNRCGMPYMIRHGESGYLVDPFDAADIAKRLTRILTDEALYRKMGETSRRIAEERFHPDVVARRTRQVYLDVLEKQQESASSG